MKEIDPEFLEKIRNNQRLRQRVAFEHPLWFSLLYLQHHFQYPFAAFHMEMFYLIEQQDHNLIEVMAFRESGKSAILNMTNVLWSVLGKPGKKFVIIVSKTQEQAKSHFLNIKGELEHNQLLIEDFGPFAESENDLKRLSLELTYHGAKIMSVTSEQSIRGLKHGSYRPDLIICDDLEDISSDNSEALYERFQTEIAPLGSINTQIFILGNLLSADSFMMKMKSEIEEGNLGGLFRAYPLLDSNGLKLWKSKFPNAKAIKTLRHKLSYGTWAREYILTLGKSYYYAEDKPVKPDPNYLYAGMNKVLKEYYSLLNIIQKAYEPHLTNLKFQFPLISQMKKFHITVPSVESRVDEIEIGDRRYEKYQEFQEKIKTVTNWYEEEFRHWIRRQWDKN